MKRYLVLLGIAVLASLAWAGTAAAQEVFTVSSNSRMVRVEGVTEAAGQVVLTTALSGGSIAANSEILIDYGTKITNAADINAAAPGAVVGGGGGCMGHFTVSAASALLTITFTATCQPAPSGFGASFTVSQVRVNASAFAAGSTIQATVSAIVPVSAQAAEPITFSGPTTLPVAVVEKATTVSVSAGSPLAILTCSATTTPMASFALGNPITVTENFPAAFSSVADEASLTAIDTITGGSNVTVTFASVPIGIAVTVSVDGTTSGTLGAVAISPAATQTSASGAQDLAFTFSFPKTDSTAKETLVIDWSAMATATFAGGTGPVTAAVSLTGATAPALIRFASNTEGSGPAFSVLPCETDLLFPFVANTVGFDTGIAIANTTTDPFTIGSAVPVNGTCTFTVFPSSGGTSVGSPVSFPIPVNSGGTGAVVLSKTAAAGMQGYAIARCNFLNAHAFAFLDNPGATGGPNLAEGYVALVIPNPALVSRAVPGSGQGEQLKQ